MGIAAAAGDEIAFAYSGHSAKAQGYGCSIISTDPYYVTHGFVMQKINAVTCSKKLLTRDACVIGDSLLDCQTGSIIATALNNTKSYNDPNLTNGAWTYYFLEGAINMGKICAEDAATYAENGMKAWAAQYHLRVIPTHNDKYTGKFDK